MSSYEKYIGEVFDDRYRIEAFLGSGGMAAVLFAWDLKEERHVAIKLLRSELSENREAVRRFINESKAVSLLHHPNIVKVIDVVITEKRKYLVMEYIEGETLRAYMDRVKVIPFDRAMDIIVQILKALSHAHERGVIHRDIKPQNILLKGSKAIVTDFGIAKLAVGDVTTDDKTIGTVYYISPEQASGEKIDYRSDLYSVGAMLFEMMTGRMPFDDDNAVAVALMQINDPPPKPRDIVPTIPVGMEQIILYALEKDPDNRFQSAGQMLEYLNILRDDPFAEFAVSPKEQAQGRIDPKKQEEKAPPKKEKKREIVYVRGDSWSPLPVILGILTAFFIVLAVAGVYAWSNIIEPSSLNVLADRSGEDVVIGDYVGKPFTEEDKTYIEDTLRYGVNSVTVEERYSEVVPKGIVIEQEPDAGDVRKLSSVKLKIVISKGSSTVENTLSDYRMKDYRQTRLYLIDQGFDVRIEAVKDSGVEKNMIIRTEPAQGSKITEGMTVVLYYSAGPTAADAIFTFPDFVGMSEGDAAGIIEKYGLNLVSVTRVYSDTFDAGTVISCSVVKGPKPRLTPLSFTVSLGRDPSLPPIDENNADDLFDGGHGEQYNV
ncbi:MAG: protein kinase [Clostridia bacterium]|nr:protein kinase [Clostridia bacterium]